VRTSFAAPCLIGLPFDASSSFLRGSAEAPPFIRQALHSDSGNLWTETMIDLAGPGALRDGGDIALPADAQGAMALIEQAITGIMASNLRPIVLGGDHSVTYPVLRAIAAAHGPVTILHVDAHPDMYDEFDGDRLSHACPFARIMEEGLASRLLQVGIRAMNGHQRAQADRYGVEVIDMRAWHAGMRPGVDGLVYISVDLDGIDPAYAPGVSHREPGGLTVRDVLGLVQQPAGSLVGADVVELNPRRDAEGITAAVAAKLVKELAGRMHADA
jgi:agmatinase